MSKYRWCIQRDVWPLRSYVVRRGGDGHFGDSTEGGPRLAVERKAYQRIPLPFFVLVCGDDVPVTWREIYPPNFLVMLAVVTHRRPNVFVDVDGHILDVRAPATHLQGGRAYR